MRDYVYLPLALRYVRLERGIANEYKPHIYAMALMGLWHGAVRAPGDCDHLFQLIAQLGHTFYGVFTTARC